MNARRSITGVVWRIQGDLVNTTNFTDVDPKHLVGHIEATARVGVDDFTWRIVGKVPAIGDIVTIEVPA